MRNLLLISSSRVHGYNYLEAAEAEIKDFLSSKNITTVLFIPYASHKHDEYLETVTAPFNKMGYRIKGIHTQDNPVEAIAQSDAIFVGGGNTFLLLKSLYENNLIDIIRKRVRDGMLYMGSSAGTNVATCSINTTNDMPIVYPPSFVALNLVPFNINPHYIESELDEKHKGETRDQRLNEYLQLPDARSVLGLREGCMLKVTDDTAVLKGIANAKLFIPNKEPVEYATNSDLSFLLA